MTQDREHSATTPRPCFVVVLHTASTANGLPAPRARDFPGLRLFSAKVKGRHQLNVGYFQDASQARIAQGILKKRFSGAWVCPVEAPWDEIRKSQFNPESLAAAQEGRPLPLSIKTPLGRSTATADSGIELVEEVPPSFELTSLSEGEVLSTLDQGAQAKESVKPMNHALELIPWLTLEQLSRISRQGIFECYRLYVKDALANGQWGFSLRLGFFSQSHNAQQVAAFVAAEYPQVRLISVSDAESLAVQRCEPSDAQELPRVRMKKLNPVKNRVQVG